jgi:hypothetical protein
VSVFIRLENFNNVDMNLCSIHAFINIDRIGTCTILKSTLVCSGGTSLGIV